MLSDTNVLWWEEVQHILYEEDGFKFGVELDLFNNHQYFFMVYPDGCEHDLDADVYNAIHEFNKRKREFRE